MVLFWVIIACFLGGSFDVCSTFVVDFEIIPIVLPKMFHNI